MANLDKWRYLRSIYPSTYLCLFSFP